MAIPGLFLFLGLFEQTKLFLQPTIVKNVYPASGAGIRTLVLL